MAIEIGMHLCRLSLAIVACAAAMTGQAPTVDLGRTFEQWWNHREERTQYEDHFVPHRNALIAAHGIVDGMLGLDFAMRSYPQPVPEWAPVDPASVEAMLRSLAQAHVKRQPLLPFLPYLTVLASVAPQDLRVPYLTCEAWSELGPKAAQQARQAVDHLIAAAASIDPAAVQSCLGTLDGWGQSEAPDNFRAAAVAVRDGLAAGSPPRTLAIHAARQHGLEQQFEKAMVDKEPERARQALVMLWKLDDHDLGAAYLMGCLGTRYKMRWSLPGAVEQSLSDEVARRALAVRIHELGFPRASQSVAAGAQDHWQTAAAERDEFAANGRFVLLREAAKAAAGDARWKWCYETIDRGKKVTGSFFRRPDGTWREEGSDGRAWDFTEIARNNEYVELSCTDHAKLVRLFAMESKIKMGRAKWAPLFIGSWKTD